MRLSRRSTSAVYSDFRSELSRLIRLDEDNQRAFSNEQGAKPVRRISKPQLHILTESTFFAAFRAYENFVREIFILYCQEKQTVDRKSVRSYVRPKNFQHAEELVRSSMRYIDWNDPGRMIIRSELFLRDGFPVKDTYASGRGKFEDMKVLRNHIAHRSAESFRTYRRLVQRHLGTQPLTVPDPGEFLLYNDSEEPSQYKLQTYLDFLSTAARNISNSA
jgi:hypothetical protein